MARLVGQLTGLSARRAAAVVFALVAAVVGVRFVAHGADPSFFVVASRPVPEAAVPAGFVLQAPGGGYDGQFFYSLAVRPLQHRDRDVIPLDNPPYRQQRIGYPFVAHVLALGSRGAVPWALVIVNVASIAAVALLLARRAVELGRPAIAGAALALAPGLTFAAARDLCEPLVLALVLGAFAASRSRRWVVVALLGCLAVLVRETAIVAVAAIALGGWLDGRRARAPDRRRALIAAVPPTLVLAGWQAYLADRWGRVPLRAAGADTVAAPVVGIIDAVGDDLARHHGIDALSLLLLALIVAFAVVCLLALGRSGASTAEKLMLVASAGLALFLGRDVYVSFAGFTRALQDLVVFGGIVALGASPRWRRAVWLVPVMWAPVALYVMARA